MNRRSFITKALAGLAAVPLLGKLVNSQPVNTVASLPQFKGPLEYGEVPYVLGRGPITRVVRITVSRQFANRINPERDRIAVNGESYQIVATSHGQAETTFDLRSALPEPPHDPATCWICRTG